MIRGFRQDAGRLAAVEDLPEALTDLVWIDLVSPSRDQERAVEAGLGVAVPTREDMEEIEASSRLYVEGETLYMTAILPAHADSDDPEMGPVSFVLAGNTLITVRYHEPRVFSTFPARAERMSIGAHDGEAVLVALLDAVIDRMADILERAGGEIEQISREVFQFGDTPPARGQQFHTLLKRIGRKGDLTSKIRDSLVTLERLSGFLGQVGVQRKSSKAVREQIKTLARDVRSLSDHANFMAQKVTFLLDATLGMISIEQNGIIKIFSVAAVVFLPPTLVASIYGMNFTAMPELDWVFGYPFALGLMAASAAGALLYFKGRGWL